MIRVPNLHSPPRPPFPHPPPTLIHHLRLRLLLHTTTDDPPHCPRGQRPPDPHSKFPTGPSILPCLRVHSLLLTSPLHIWSTLIIRPPAATVNLHWSPVLLRLMSNLSLTGLPCLNVIRSRHLRDLPAWPVWVVVPGIGGWGVSRTDTETPLVILDFFDAMILDLFGDLESPPPPILFLVQLSVFQTPPLQMGGVFCGLPALPPSYSLTWTRSSCRPNQSLAASVPRPWSLNPPPSPAPVRLLYQGPVATENPGK